MRESVPVDEFINCAGNKEAIYTNSSGNTSNIIVIFGSAIADAVVVKTEVSNTNLIATAKTSDVEDVTNSCRLEIDDVNYYITDFNDDGQGFTLLHLSTVSGIS